MGGGYKTYPAGMDAIIQRFRDIGARIDGLQKQFANLGITIDRVNNRLIFGAGRSAYIAGGHLVVQDPDGNVVFTAGEGVIPDGSGRTQSTVGLMRDDGTTALMLADTGTIPGHPHRQALQWQDRAGNIVMADDTNGGQGMALPYIPLSPMVNANVNTWPATAATTWTHIADCYIQRQHPRLAWAINIEADTGTTGQVRLVLDGVVIATSPTVTAAFSMWQGIYAQPAGWTYQQTSVLSLEAQVTAGTGSIRAAVYQVIGVQS